MQLKSRLKIESVAVGQFEQQQLDLDAPRVARADVVEEAQREEVVHHEVSRAHHLEHESVDTQTHTQGGS